MWFSFKNAESNKIVFKDFIDGYTYKDGEYMYGSGNFEKFLSIDSQHYNQLDSFEVYAYDDCGNNDIQKLALLYWAMQDEGIDVDNSVSEHEFEFFTDVPVQLVNSAMKMFQPKQEFN